MAAERLGKLEEQFEARWKRAYEVRHLENQNRHKAAADEGKVVVQPEIVNSAPAREKQAGIAPAVTVHASVAASPALQPDAHSLPSTAVSTSGKPIRQREVEDEDDDTPCQPGAASEMEEESEPECRVVWDSSHSSHRPTVSLPAASNSESAAAKLKEQGSERLRQGDFEGALACYTKAVRTCLAEKDSTELLAALYSNKAHVLHKLKRNQEAAADALEAHRLLPTWPKPLFRLAQAQLALGLFGPAVGSCLKGKELSKKDSEGHTEFTPLLDRVAVSGAKYGNPVGYTGLLLEVRDAGEEAWLGRPAPHVPELDGPEDEDSLLPATKLALPSTSGDAAAGALAALSVSGTAAEDALATWDYRHSSAVKERRRTSFRSIKEAVTAAQDGDRIILRRGTHNGMGEAVNINKRILILGEGELGETVIDQRANSPTFRITRGGVVIKNLDLDMSGFCEAVMVIGGPTVQPLIEDCLIKCSGDDGINISDQADPTFRRCQVTVKKCGARVYGSSRGCFEECTFEKCGEQAFKAMESAAPVLSSCTLSECGEEGVISMDTAKVTLIDCTIKGCKGPGVDCSEKGQAVIRGGRIEGNVGGVWVWDSARAVLKGADLAGGPSHAILADGAGSLDVKETTIRGTVHATEQAWEGILHESNAMEDPEQPTDFPPEEGPFKFVPDRFTRKQ